MLSARLTLVLAAASALTHLGCTAACNTSPDANPPQVYTAGTATGDATSGKVYESSPATSGLLPFPGGKQYYLEHHLGFTPTYPLIYVGFNANGQDLAPCAGNTCVVPCVNSEVIWLRNDSCADFVVRIVTTQKSGDQKGTVCPGGGSISVGGAPNALDAAPLDAAPLDAAPAE